MVDDKMWEIWRRHLMSGGLIMLTVGLFMVFVGSAMVDKKIADAIKLTAEESRTVAGLQNASLQRYGQELAVLSEQLRLVSETQRNRTRRIDEVDELVSKVKSLEIKAEAIDKAMKDKQ